MTSTTTLKEKSATMIAALGITIALLFFSNYKSYGQPAWQWLKSYHSGGGHNLIIKSHLDDAGNVYIFGRCARRALMDTGERVDPPTEIEWSHGIIIAKINPQGEFVWKKFFRGLVNICWADPMFAEINNNKIIVWFNYRITGSTVDYFGNIQNLTQTGTPPFRGGRFSAFVTFDFDGNILDNLFIQLESREIQPPVPPLGERRDTYPLGFGFSAASCFHKDNNNNYYIYTGVEVQDFETESAHLPYTLLVYNGDVTTTHDFYIPKQPPITGIGGIEFIRIKINSNGTVDWIKPMVDTIIRNDNVSVLFPLTISSKHISFDNDDNMYLTGQLSCNSYTDITTASFPINIFLDQTHNHKITLKDEAAEKYQGFLIKYDTNGNVKWCNQLYAKRIVNNYRETFGCSSFCGKIITDNEVFLSCYVSELIETKIYMDYNETIEFRNNPEGNNDEHRAAIVKYDKQTGAYITHGTILRSTGSLEPAMLGDYILANARFYNNINYVDLSPNIMITKFKASDCQYVGVEDTIFFDSNSGIGPTGSVHTNLQGQTLVDFSGSTQQKSTRVTLGNLTIPFLNNSPVFALKSSGVTTPLYSISGTVKDNNNIGVQGIQIRYLTTSVFTNQNGDYVINNIPQGLNITLTPYNTNYTFSPTNKTINNITQDTANNNFVATPLQTYTVSVSSNPTNGGMVNGGGNFPVNTQVTVTANANANYTFVNWTENGNIVSTSANYQFTLTQNRVLVAHFVAMSETEINISGIVMRQNTTRLSAGVVSLYKIENMTQYSLVSSVPIENDGSYIFRNVTAGVYIIKAIPQSSENAVPTYYGDTELWHLATFVPVTNISVQDKNITIIPVAEIADGNSIISGYVGEDDVAKFLSSKSVNNPVSGVDVYLQKQQNATWITVANTLSNENGYFEFRNVPVGTYRVIIEITGLPQTNPPIIEITEDGEVKDNMIFIITETEILYTDDISITNSPLGIRNEIIVYPNPANETLNFSEASTFEITDIQGRVLLGSDKAVKTVSIDKLPVGMYIIKIGNKAITFVKE